MSSNFYSKIESEVRENIKASNLTPACKLGCTYCCEDVSLFVYLDEINVIVSALNKLDFKTRKTIQKRIKKIDEEWSFKNFKNVVNQKDAEEVINYVEENHYRCPLLFGDKCIIYANKPAICRVHFCSDENLCKANINNADMSYASVSKKYATHYKDNITNLVIMPIPLFRNIDFNENKFVSLVQKGRFEKIDIAPKNKPNLWKKFLDFIQIK